MKQDEGEITALSTRLQTNVLAFSGKQPGPPPRFRAQLLIPVAIIIAGVLLISFSPQARNQVLLKLAMRASTRLLQTHSQPSQSSQP